jgi:hydrogenase-4 component E
VAMSPHATDTVFAELAVLGASLTLIFGLVPLWRRRSAAHIGAFSGQSIALAATTAVTAYFTRDGQLYAVAAILFLLKGVGIPILLARMDRRFGEERELEPYVNTSTSLLLGGLLVVLAYVVTRPLAALSQLPTRAGLPLAMGLIFVSLFVIISRKKALTQVTGFLMLENGIALLAVLATYGIPIILEMGVFLDALMGFLVMQIFVYQIHETFDMMDVEQLTRLKH